MILLLAFTNLMIFTANAQNSTNVVQPQTMVPVNGSSESSAAANSATAKTEPVSLDTGLKFYQEKKYVEAAAVFEALLMREPESCDLRVNLALALSQANRRGAAIGHLRFCELNAKTSAQAAAAKQALTFLLPQLAGNSFNQNNAGFSVLQKQFSHVPWMLLLGLTLFCLFFSIHRWMHYKAAATNQDETSKTNPGSPFLALVFFGATFLLASLTLVAFLEASTIRATVMMENAPLFSFPQADAAQLVQLPEGLEVVVEKGLSKESENWSQVRVNEQLVGWIQDENILKSR